MMQNIASFFCLTLLILTTDVMHGECFVSQAYFCLFRTFEKSTEDVLYSVTLRSRLHCAHMCLTEVQCSTYEYNRDGNTCTLTEDKYLDEELNMHVEVETYLYASTAH